MAALLEMRRGPLACQLLLDGTTGHVDETGQANAALVVASVAPWSQKTVEPAGFSYQQMLLRLAGPDAAGSGKKRQRHADDGDVDLEDTLTLAQRKKIAAAGIDAQNHYKVLGVERLNINASDDQIRRAYRKLVLKYHPDKQQQTAQGSSAPSAKVDAASDPVFLSIQKAYDVLSNEKLRRGFDSQYEFDESIPSGNEKGDFFSVYGPVFERNSRWSAIKPVPQLGREDEEDETVKTFYAFWMGFESWRDFSAEGEHKPEEASCREEKRWMERENEKGAAKKKKLEVQRIFDLVQRAYARDPRVKRMKDAEEEAKRQARAGKMNAKKAAEEAAKKKQEEEAAAAAAAEEAKRQEEKAKKLAKEKEKKALKRWHMLSLPERLH